MAILYDPEITSDKTGANLEGQAARFVDQGARHDQRYRPTTVTATWKARLQEVRLESTGALMKYMIGVSIRARVQLGRLLHLWVCGQLLPLTWQLRGQTAGAQEIRLNITADKLVNRPRNRPKHKL